MKRLSGLAFIPAILAAGVLLGSQFSPLAAQEPAAAGRRTISLDGMWQIGEGGLDIMPAKFERQVPVPGLVDMATPPFVEPGPRVANRQQEKQKDPRRDAFWYRRTFQMTGPVPAVARLKIGKAMFGTRVFLNGKLLGDHAPSFTPGFFDARPALQAGTNTLIVRVGADRDAVIGRAESARDGEKIRYIPGIFDSVELILSGTPHILNVQAVPNIDDQTAGVHVWLRYTGVPAAEELHITIREVSTGQVAGEADSHIAAPTDGTEQKALINIPIRRCRLWSPEDPFLYQLEIHGSADSYTTRFGMRSFRFDPVTGRAVLNGRPYFMRGTNVTLYRFFEDPLRGDKPWREDWVRRLHKSFHDMHWNSVRYCIGFAPETWYRVADEEGILIQDEFPIWMGEAKPGELDGDWVAAEYREWMEERWNHASVVIWDACNETSSPETARAIRQVRGLDYSNRPWDNGWGVPVDPGDSDEAHPYHFIFGPDQPFRMNMLARDPGTKAGLLIAQPFAEEKLRRTNAIIINEYGGLWLNRDGSPTTLSQPIYDYLMDPSATTAQRRRLYARNMAAITEFFRAHRKAAGVLQFCALGYSRPDGQTSDDWVDVEKLSRDRDFYTYVRDAFAPVGLMVDSWADEYAAGTTKEFPVLLVNDLKEAWAGDVRLRLLRDGDILEEETKPASVESLGSGRITFTVSIPEQPAGYQVEATLLATPDGPVRSLRDFSVLTPQQREARRNLAEGQPATASSAPSASSRPEYVVDGKGQTHWSPDHRVPQDLSVDLGQQQTVSRVEVTWGWGGLPGAYSIQVSVDDVSWKTIHAVEKETAPNETIRFTAVPARWIRVHIEPDDSAYSLSELGVYH
jgi:hypothetical protein